MKPYFPPFPLLCLSRPAIPKIPPSSSSSFPLPILSLLPCLRRRRRLRPFIPPHAGGGPRRRPTSPSKISLPSVTRREGREGRGGEATFDQEKRISLLLSFLSPIARPNSRSRSEERERRRRKGGMVVPSRVAPKEVGGEKHLDLPPRGPSSFLPRPPASHPRRHQSV